MRYIPKEDFVFSNSDVSTRVTEELKAILGHASHIYGLQCGNVGFDLKDVRSDDRVCEPSFLTKIVQNVDLIEGLLVADQGW